MTPKAPSRGAAARALLAALALAPCFALAVLIWQNAVDVLYWDEWDFVWLVDAFRNGTLESADLLGRFNGHRLPVFRLIMLALAPLTGWDVRYEMWLTFAVVCAIAAGLYRLGRVTAPVPRTVSLVLLLLSNVLLFSPAQAENWLMGMQFIIMIPTLFLVAGLLVAASRLRAGTKWLACATLATAATVTFSPGVLCWLLFLPPLAWPAAPYQGRPRWGPILGWSAVSALVIGAMAVDAPGRRSGGLVAGPGAIAEYLLVFLGGPFALGTVVPLTLAVASGAFLVLLYVASCVLAIRTLRSGKDGRPVVIWLMVGAYPILVGAMAALQRSHLGVEQALASRYIAFSALLPIALAHVAAIALAASARDRCPVGWTPAVAVASSVFSALLALHLLAAGTGVRQMRTLRQERLEGKAGVTFVGVLPDEELTRRVYHTTSILRGSVDMLDRLGMLRPRLKRTRHMEPGGSGADAGSHGRLETFVLGADGRYAAEGWAALPARGQPADAVVLGYEAGDGSCCTAFALARRDQTLDQTYLWRATGKRYLRHSGWRKSIPKDAVPPGARRVFAWAFDARTGDAFRLSGSVALP